MNASLKNKKSSLNAPLEVAQALALVHASLNDRKSTSKKVLGERIKKIFDEYINVQDESGKTTINVQDESGKTKLHRNAGLGHLE